MAPAATTPAELAVSLAACLEEANVPYAIGGAVAYGYWGVPRGAQDLDLNIFLAVDQAGVAVDALLAGGVRLEKQQALATPAAGTATCPSTCSSSPSPCTSRRLAAPWK